MNHRLVQSIISLSKTTFLLLEIACFHIESAIAAAQAGADRIELCSNPAEGGTTPSFGTIKTALASITIPVFPIIRPRGGDFLYTAYEFETMLHEVQVCRQLGCKGAVLGLLQKDGSIDVQRTTQLVQAAGPMHLTFHRAFDRAINPQQALEDVIATGCKRLLSSGQQPAAVQGKLLIQQLVAQAKDRIIILPGGGIRSTNIADIATYSGATELHSAARCVQTSAMDFVQQNMDEDLNITTVNTIEIKQMKAVLQSIGR